jgi:hypothetical protein
MNANIAGSMILGLPALVVAWFFLWKKHRPIFWFACVMILVGLGYLWATGAAGDIGRRVAPGMAATLPTAVPAR